MLNFSLFELLALPLLLAIFLGLDQSSFTRWLQLPVLVILLSGWMALRAEARGHNPRRGALTTGALAGAAIGAYQWFSLGGRSYSPVLLQLTGAIFCGAVLGTVIAAIPIARQLFPRADAADVSSAASDAAGNPIANDAARDETSAR